MPNDWTTFWRLATTGAIPRRALKVALVVGTVLTLINQGDTLFASGQINWFKCGLTYIVPFLVSTYSAIAARTQASA